MGVGTGDGEERRSRGREQRMTGLNGTERGAAADRLMGGGEGGGACIGTGTGRQGQGLAGGGGREGRGNDTGSGKVRDLGERSEAEGRGVRRRTREEG